MPNVSTSEPSVAAAARESTGGSLVLSSLVLADGYVEVEFTSLALAEDASVTATSDGSLLGAVPVAIDCVVDVETDECVVVESAGMLLAPPAVTLVVSLAPGFWRVFVPCPQPTTIPRSENTRRGLGMAKTR
jgi:hypothetical protein